MPDNVVSFNSHRWHWIVTGSGVVDRFSFPVTTRAGRPSDAMEQAARECPGFKPVSATLVHRPERQPSLDLTRGPLL